jgi:hypothetical protein
MSSDLKTEVVFNAKELVKALNSLEPGMKNAMVKEMRQVSAPAISAIKLAIPKTNPFISPIRPVANTRGRLGWGVKVKPDTVKPSFTTKASKKTAVTSLVRIVVSSPATALADVAGKGSGAVLNPVTKPYDYKGGTRTHRTTTQGQKMIKHMKKKKASNFVYPSVEKILPMVKLEIKLVLETYAAKVNRRINR